MSDEQPQASPPVEEKAVDTSPESSEPKVEEPSQEDFLLEKAVFLPVSKKEVVVKKLKALDYYKAQQQFLRWIQTVADMEKLRSLEMKDILDSEGNPDLAKIEKMDTPMARETADKVLDLAEKAEVMKATLVSTCMGEDVSLSYYPEDINEVFPVVMQVNGFYSNIKKRGRHTSTNSQTK